MERMEELIRESLQARAQDVEPTPALWLEVDRRVTRRRRFRVASWSLAGVTAVLAAVLAVPAVIGMFSGPEQIEIPPLDRTPATGVVSTHVVAVDDDGVARLLDLRSGEPVRDLVELGFVPADLAVSPTSTVDGVELAAISASGEFTVLGAGGQTWSGGDVDAPDGFAWSVVAAPDGRWFAAASPTEEADGATVSVAPPVSSWAAGEDVDWTEIGMVIDQRSRLVAWTGEATDEGDRSQLWLVTADGTLTSETLEIVDGVPTSLEVGLGDMGWTALDAATSFAEAGAEGEPFYLLRRAAQGFELAWVGPDGAREEVALDGLLGDVDPADVWLDAKQDGALVGDGERTWLVTHDGAGAFAEPVALADGFARVAMLDAPRPGAAPTEAPTAAPTEEPTEPPTDQPAGPAVEGAALPGPIVTISMRDLVLHGPDGAEVLHSLSPEGESIFVAARVRPGSTIDDLTVVTLTQGEGMFDLRTYRYVDGEFAWEYFRDDLQPGFGGMAGEGAMATAPVWSPAGDHLAWFEFGTGPATMRVVGWDDGAGTGDSATDNAAFEIDTRGQVPLVPVEWVSSPGGTSATEIRAVGLDSNEGWYALPVDIQGDGAVALTSSEFEVRNSFAGGVILGVASDAVASPRWLVQSTFDGVMLHETGVEPGSARSTSMPADLLPGDGLAQLWVRAIGDGALVGSPNTGVGYLVVADRDVPGTAYATHRLPGEVIDADVIR